MSISGDKKSNAKKDSNNALKAIKIMIIATVLLLIAIIGLTIYLSIQRSKDFKVEIDGKSISKIDKSMFLIEGDKVKVKIRDIAPYLGKYEYRNGQYGRENQYSEDKNSCYLIGKNEVATFVNDSNIVEKVIINETVEVTGEESSGNSENNNKEVKNLKFEKIKIKNPVTIINGEIYTDLEGIDRGFNVQATYDTEQNKLSIYTLPYLVNFYSSKISNQAIAQADSLFSNQKAVLYGYIVVKDTNGVLYGVNEISQKNENIIGEKYKSLKFVEGNQEFIVETEENKKGIIAIKDNVSNNKINPIYDSISEIDEGTYKVSNNGKYGIINNKGKSIVDVSYDEVGLDTNQATKFDIDNTYIFYDDVIPVKVDKMWGLYSKSTGKIIADPIYENFGFVTGKTITDANIKNTILIPEYEGIIVQKDGKYGIINSLGKIVLPIETSGIYTKSNGEEGEYYFMYKEKETNLIEFLKKNNILPINK